MSIKQSSYGIWILCSATAVAIFAGQHEDMVYNHPLQAIAISAGLIFTAFMAVILTELYLVSRRT